MFINLYFLSDPAFRDHNFSDFWNYTGGGDSIERQSEAQIEAYIRRSFLADAGRAGHLHGFPPDFYPILTVTLSVSCAESFIRSNPAWPITVRDYRLSKLFQFVLATLMERFGEELSSRGDTGIQLHSLLERLPAELLAHEARIDWHDFWWPFYNDCLARALQEVIDLLTFRLTSLVGHKGQKKRSRGPKPNMERHRKIKTIVAIYERNGMEWREQLPALCGALDKAGVDCSQGRENQRTVLWTEKLSERSGPDKVKKNIEHALKTASRPDEA